MYSLYILILIAAQFISVSIAFSQTSSILIYKTGFEYEEGFDPQYLLIGQGGWTGEGSGWNGLIADEEYFPGFGQQAYIGYSSFSPISQSSVVWKPLNYQVLTNYPVIKFSVIFQIKDSTNRRYDDFRWSVYNTDTQRLFSVDFDNETLEINYSLDAPGEFFSTGYTFSNDGLYELVIAMNFSRNRWIATINNVPIVGPLPMTTYGYSLSLGDIDAAWVLHNISAPGDNYMVFDEFTVTAEQVVYPPKLIMANILSNEPPKLMIFSEPATRAVIQKSTNLINWVDVSTNNVMPDGIINWTDNTNASFGFYRAKMLL